MELEMCVLLLCVTEHSGNVAAKIVWIE